MHKADVERTAPLARPAQHMGTSTWADLRRRALRFKPQLLAYLTIFAAAGCGTFYEHYPLSKPALATGPQLTVSATKVGLNATHTGHEIDDDLRLLVLLELTPTADMLLDLRDTRLLFGADRELAPIATGTSDATQRIADGDFAPALELHAGKSQRAWVVFAGFEGPVPDLPQRIRLRVQPELEVTLSEPGVEPHWQEPAVKSSAGAGPLWVQTSEDEANVNALLYHGRGAIGPIVLGFRYGLGLRSVPFQRGLFCCNTAFAGELELPVVKSSSFVMSPYLGIEGAAMHTDEDVQRRRLWIGPALGVQLGFARLRSTHHGPFPLAQPASPLTAFNIRIGLTNWFGAERSFPSLGFVSSFSVMVGQ